MKQLLRAFSLFPILFVCLVSAATTIRGQGFQVDGTELLDASGQPFVMRGVNMTHTWFSMFSKDTLWELKQLQCNTVRIVLSNGEQEGWRKTIPLEVERLLDWCYQQQLVAVVEVHDCTGYGDKEGAAHPDTAVEYWLDPEIQKVLKGRENYVILNIANEPFGSQSSGDMWASFHVKAVAQLRKAGYKHTIQVDGANWGQDHARIMLNQAEQVIAADPMGNTMFSVHMYQVYGDEEVVWDYLRTAKEVKGLCIIVGEFGMDHQQEPVAELAILEACYELEIGYLGWSWSGNNEANAHLDLVYDFDVNRLTEWGDLLFNHPTWGIKATSKQAAF